MARRRGDILRGGLADSMGPRQFDPEELRRGAEHELEHTDDPDVAREIAMDHLSEDPNYYANLDAMEAASEEHKARMRYEAEAAKRRACDLRREMQDRLLADAVFMDKRRRG